MRVWIRIGMQSKAAPSEDQHSVQEPGERDRLALEGPVEVPDVAVEVDGEGGGRRAQWVLACGPLFAPVEQVRQRRRELRGTQPQRTALLEESRVLRVGHREEDGRTRDEHAVGSRSRVARALGLEIEGESVYLLQANLDV